METTILTSGQNIHYKHLAPLLMFNVFQLIELNMFPGELRFILFSYLLIFKFSIFLYKSMQLHLNIIY